MRLEAIVTTVDALFGETQLAQHPECGKQVMLADRLVLTKADLVATESVEQLRRVIGDQNPLAPMLLASHGGVDAGLLFPPAFFGPSVPASAPHRSALFARRSIQTTPDATTRCHLPPIVR